MSEKSNPAQKQGPSHDHSLKDGDSHQTRGHEDHHGHHHSHHGHSHTHHHHHHHDSGDQSLSALVYAFALNFGFCIIEAIGGAYASSQAVMADALHDFGDSLSLLLLIALRILAQRPAAPRYSFGYRRLNIIGAAVVGLSLIGGCMIILGHSLPRLLHPEPVNGPLMLVLAVFGVIVNGAAFWRLKGHGGVGESLVSLHLLEDLWGWVIVFVGSLAITTWSWYWLDPLLSVFLAFFILWRSFGQIRRIGRLFLLGSSRQFSAEKVRSLILEVEGVVDLHHLHTWELDEGFHIITAHVVVENGDTVLIKQQIREKLLPFGRCEATLELEQVGEKCLDPEHQP